MLYTPEQINQFSQKPPRSMSDIANTLFEHVGDFAFQKSIDAFNSKLLTKFVQRLALCLTFNTNKLPEKLTKTFPTTSFTDTDSSPFTLPTDCDEESSSFKYKELFTVGLYKDYGNNLSSLIDCIMRSFAESDVPADFYPKFDGNIN